MSENDLKLYNIIYLPELPSNDENIDRETTKIAIPSGEKGKFKLYAWFEGRWVCTCFIESFINKSDFELKKLRDACNDLHRAADKLTEISANTESDELSLKLEKITKKISQAKNELTNDVIDHFGENELHSQQSPAPLWGGVVHELDDTEVQDEEFFFSDVERSPNYTTEKSVILFGHPK